MPSTRRIPESDSGGEGRRPGTGGGGRNTRGKGPKVKEEKKVNGKGKARARSVLSQSEDEDEVADEDADAEEEEEGGEEGEQGSPRGNKRQRVNGDGDSRQSGSQRQGDEPRMKTLPRDKDGFIPGSIVRIQLQNFVTYDYVEFRPGPYLNMIIGPNGTGKSSIACAIALGLNFPPSILGRASDLNSFVKNGTDKGYIEIELKAPSGKPNLVIRRSLSAKSKGSTFTLNGQAATGNEIKQKMTELNVQVGNLCSFLPQDKVSAFASMTPQELLAETQRAAGDPNLTNWHKILVEAGNELKGMNGTLKNYQESLHQMIERNEGIERDVQRFLERKKIEQEIVILEILIPLARYRKLKDEYVSLKAKQRVLHSKVARLKKKNDPAHDLLKKLVANAAELTREREKMKRSTVAKVKQMSSKYAENEKLETEAETVVDHLGTLKREEKERVKGIKNKENEIAKIEEELAKPAAKLEKIEDLNDEWKQINLERSPVLQKHGELEHQLKKVLAKKVEAKSAAEQATKCLKELDTSDSRKMNILRGWDNDTLDAIMWLRQNKHLFKMEVFEPPLMCVSVNDPAFTSQVEACINSNQMRCFVAQCKEDLDTLNHNINDSTISGRKIRVNTWWRGYHPESLIPEPMSPEEMAEVGFDGYALQYLEYPPGMEWYLKKELNLHRTAIARNSNIDVNKAMTFVGRPIRHHGGGGSFINGFTYNIVTRSRYGRKALGNVTRDIGQARNLVVPPVDMVEKRRLEGIISQNQHDESMAEEKKKELQQQLNDLQKEDQGFTARFDSVKKRKREIETEERRIGSLKGRLARQRDDLKTLREAPSADDERIKLRKKLLSISHKRITIARDYTKLARSIITEQTENTRVGLDYRQTIANQDALQALCDLKDDKYKKAVIEYTQVHDQYTKRKDESHAALIAIRETAQTLEGEVKEKFMLIEQLRAQYDKDLKAAQEKGLPPPDGTDVELRTLDQLETELATQRTNLDMNLNTNPGVLEEYEKRKRDIKVLEQNIEQQKRVADRVERNIKNARDNWQPALEKLVASIGEKFSAAFDRIGCAGEIRIGEHEDYEQWAINIYVKFRDTEKLQLLTGQRQSGGERSLTTILYLMSLTEEARAPFSLVDEINQGMDQRAERNVHNSMVEVTCKEDSAQYFLITPKLLSDLDYHERMKILCVNNGEWLPEERDLGNMMTMIEGFIQRNRNCRASNAA